jgi:hypothetical protein
VLLDYYDGPNFLLEVTERKRHWDFTPKTPVWIIIGHLKAAIKDPFRDTLTTYKWGFRAIVGFNQEGYFVIDLPAGDESGSYSSFIRSVIWEKLRRKM